MKRSVALTLAALALLAAPRIVRLGSAHLLALDLLLPGNWVPTVQAVSREPAAPGGVPNDRYRPAGRVRGGLVLVPGLSRTGKDHPAFRHLAASLARKGFLVIAPDFPGLRQFHVSATDVETIVRAVQALTAEAPPPIGILGFSFGAGPTLLAAADPRIRDRVDLVGSFGGYWDLPDVIRFVTTGWYAEDDGWHRRTQQSYNRWKLLAALAPYAADPRERERLQRLVDLKLANPSEDVSVQARRLGSEGRQLLALVEARERERLDELLAALNPAIRERLSQLSPATAIARVRAWVLVAHGRDDDSIPYTESVRLARAAPNLGRLVVFDGYTHTFPSEGGWLTRLRQIRDVERLVSLLDDLLATRW